ncbi:hypothetical protein [Gymnodinialimonas sp.]
MDIQTVRDRLGLAADGTVSGGKITIDATTLQALDPAGDVATLMKGSFSGKDIVISGAAGNAAGAADVVITGTAAFVLGTYPVTLTVSLPTVTQVLLVFSFDATATKDWVFSDSFKSLPTVFTEKLIGETQKSLLDYLAVNKGAFVVASAKPTTGDTSLIAGINFRGEVTVNAVFGIVQDVVDQLGGIPMSGTITLPADDAKSPALGDGEVPWASGTPAPGIDLWVDIGKSLKLGTTATFAVDALHIYSPATKKWLAGNPTYQPMVALTGSVALPKLGRTVNVVADMPVGTGEAAIGLTMTPPTLPSFAQLADFFGATDVSGTVTKVFADVGPSSAGNPFSDLQIIKASMLVGTKNKLPTVLRASVSVGMPNMHWVLFDENLFVAESMSVSLTVTTPFDGPKLTLVGDGLVKVAGVPIALEARREDAQVSVVASLDDKVNLPINNLVGTYLPGITPPSDLTIDSMILTIQPGKLYSFSLTMAQEPNTWKIDLGPTDIEFKNVSVLASKAAGGTASGSFSAEAQIGPVLLSAELATPGDFKVMGTLPEIKLSQIVNGLTHTQLMAPDGFDLNFTDSYVLIDKSGADYRFGLGTTIEEISTLVFVVQKGAQGWGFAAGLNVSVADVSKLDGGVAQTVADFAEWFPFQDFTLAVSTITDTSFSFPAAKTFGDEFKDAPNIKLPVISKGIQPGFYLYTTTKFTRENKILKALIDVLQIPEATILQAMLAYQKTEGLQLGVALETYLSPVDNVADRTYAGKLGYENTAIQGMMTIGVGGSNGFTFALDAKLKTLIDTHEAEFEVVLQVVENGILVAGSMDTTTPLQFGPVQVGQLGLAIGITWEAIPAFGFAASLEVDGAFDSSVAIMLDTTNPSNSLLAASLSDLSVDDVIVHMLPEDVSADIPSEIRSIMDSIAIRGYPDSNFDVPAADTADFIAALNSFDGKVISKVFDKAGNVAGFPTTSEGMQLTVDRKNTDALSHWYITQRGGTPSNPTVTHWQIKKSDGTVTVGKEAQLYVSPPGGASIAGLNYPEGVKVSGQLSVLFLKVSAEIVVLTDKGLVVNTEIGRILLGKISEDNYIFALTSADGKSGPRFSLATFEQPSKPTEAEQSPHVLVDGDMSILGIKRSSFLSINKGGAQVDISGSLIPGISGRIAGTIDVHSGIDLLAALEVGIGTLDFGSLGKLKIETGVAGQVEIWANKTSIGASVTMGFKLAGKVYNLPKFELDLKFQDLTHLAKLLFDKVFAFLKQLFTDPKAWAKIASDAMGWATDKIEGALTSVFGLSPDEAKAVLAVICPMSLAVTSL